MDFQEMFAQQSFERPEAQHFDTGDIYLPDLTDLDASALSAEALQEAADAYLPQAEGRSSAEGGAAGMLQTALGSNNYSGGIPEWNLMENEPSQSIHAQPFQSEHGYFNSQLAPQPSSVKEVSDEDEETLRNRYSAEASASGSDLEMEGDEDADDMSSGEDGSRRSTPKRHKGSGSTGRTRRNILPRIMRGQRCGHCHTCLNPKMKKACLTVRQQQMSELQQKGELPLSMINQVGVEGMAASLPPRPSVPPRPATKQGADFSGLAVDKPSKPKKRVQQPGPDLFTREIQAIADRNGGVDARYLSTLQRLFQSESQLERRLVLMTILKQSPSGTLKEAVRHQKVVLELQKWLLAAVDTKEFRLAFRVIESLDKLPIDLAALQSTGVGKTLAKLRKSGPEELRTLADNLVKKWKTSVNQVPAPDNSESAKRLREPAADPGGSKKPKTAPAKSSADSREGPSAATPLEVDDTAMFQRKKVPSISLEESISQMRKTHQIKVLNEEASKQLKSEVANGNPANGAAPSDEADGQSKGVDNVPSGPTKLGGQATAPNSALGGPLGSSRLTGSGSSITRIGGQWAPIASLSLSFEETPTAASRAAAAAAKIPEPPQLPKKQKGKTVSWTEDSSLVLIRYFLREDPVVAVRADAKGTTELDSSAPATAEEDHPPGFVSAAKREHQNEAAALRNHRLEFGTQLDEEEGDDTQAAPPPQAEGSETLPAQVPVRQLPAKMFRPMVDWPIRYGGPPFALNLEAEFKIPADDERLATPAAVDRALQIARQAAVRYPHPSMIPATPAEAPAEAPMASSPRRIPLEHTPTLQPAAADQMQMPSAAQPAPAQQPLPGARSSTPLPGFPSQVMQPNHMQAPPGITAVRPPPGGFVAPPQQLPMAPMHVPMAAAPGQPRPHAPHAPEGGRGRGPPMRGRGRGRGRWQRGDDAAVEGRGGPRPNQRNVENAPVQWRAAEKQHPAHLTPCKWYFGPQGCAKGDHCRFSHSLPHR